MPAFDSFAGLARYLEQAAQALPAEIGQALDQIGPRIETAVREKIGQWQAPSSPIHAATDMAGTAATARMMPATEDDLRERVTRTRSQHGDEQSVTVGSDCAALLWQEAGTATTAPRPAFGPALLESQKAAQVLLQQAVDKALTKASMT